VADILSITVALLAISQLFIKTEGWSKTMKLLCLIVLGAISILIISFGNSSPAFVNAISENSVAPIESRPTDTSPTEKPQVVATAVITNPPANPTTTQKAQTAAPATDGQPYNINRSDKVGNFQRGKHYPYICDPEIKNCLGFTMRFSYQLSEGHYVKNGWLVCVRENGKDWVQVAEITINEGEEKEFTIRFDRAISFTEIVVQRPVDYNGYINTDSLSIYDIVYN